MKFISVMARHIFLNFALISPVFRVTFFKSEFISMQYYDNEAIFFLKIVHDDQVCVTSQKQLQFCI